MGRRASRDPKPFSVIAVLDQDALSAIRTQIGPFNDYHLPSKDELLQMYLVLKLNNVGNFADAMYWSSSENDFETAWWRNFGNGTHGFTVKYNTISVRACRAFTTTTNYNLRDIGPAGGYIFYKNGNDYLEAAPSDQSASQVWSNVVDAEVGNTSEAIGSGQTNTTAIINQSSHTASAAKLCSDLIIGAATISLTEQQIEDIVALIPEVDISGKVDKVTGKGLSTEDYTTAEKSKLSGIESGAEANNISDVNATDLTDGGETTLHTHPGSSVTPTSWGKYY